MTDNKKISYRPDIDGLRAFAVIIVLIFHSGLGCSGGFVGVDIFFVISGYLITSLIWKDLEANEFSFAEFWERRARRIAPALIVVTLLTIVAGWWTLLPDEFRSLAYAALSQCFFAANVYYWRDSGYFGEEAYLRPLLHTWSLAVEEQFYFVIPVVLWALHRWSPGKAHVRVPCVLGFMAIGSFVTSVYALDKHPWATFYLLPTRAWELLIGSLLSFFQGKGSSTSRWRVGRELLAWCGLGSMVFPVFVYSLFTPFPGLAALPPCMGAAMLIWSCNTDRPLFLARLLSIRPIVFVGQISYSLYLWHWPLFAYANCISFGSLSTFQRVSLMLASIGIAILSWRFIETPVRQRYIASSRSSIFAMSLSGMGAICAMGVVVLFFGGFPSRVAESAMKFADAKYDHPNFVAGTVFDVRKRRSEEVKDSSLDDVRQERMIQLGAPRGDAQTIAFIWGDSHARSALPAFHELLKESQIAAEAAVCSAMPPVLDSEWSPTYGLKGGNVIEFNTGVMRYIKSKPISDLFLVARWSHYNKNAQYKPQFVNALTKTVKQLTDRVPRVWILLQVPEPGFNVPRLLALYSHSIDGREQLLRAPSESDQWDGFTREELDELASLGVRILNPKESFLNRTRDRYRIHSDSIAFYFDDDHLSSQGARQVLWPFLKKTVGEVLEKR